MGRSPWNRCSKIVFFGCFWSDREDRLIPYFLDALHLEGRFLTYVCSDIACLLFGQTPDFVVANLSVFIMVLSPNGGYLQIATESVAKFGRILRPDYSTFCIWTGLFGMSPPGMANPTLKYTRGVPRARPSGRPYGTQANAAGGGARPMEAMRRAFYRANDIAKSATKNI